MTEVVTAAGGLARIRSAAPRGAAQVALAFVLASCASSSRTASTTESPTSSGSLSGSTGVVPLRTAPPHPDDALSAARRYLARVLHTQGLTPAEVIPVSHTMVRVPVLNGVRGVALLTLKRTSATWIVTSVEPGTPGLAVRTVVSKPGQVSVWGNTEGVHERVRLLVVRGDGLPRGSARLRSGAGGRWHSTVTVTPGSVRGGLLVVSVLRRDGTLASILTRRL